MTTSVIDLANEMLELPAEDRAKILELLIASFEPPPDHHQTWLKLALERRNEVLDGKAAMVDGAQAMKRIRAQLQRRFWSNLNGSLTC
jgi:hypothetical protein